MLSYRRSNSSDVPPRRAITLVELIVAIGLLGLVSTMVFMVYRFAFVKQTLSSEMVESIRDVVLTINYLKNDLNSAILNPADISVNAVGGQESPLKIDDAVIASVKEGQDKFGFLITEGAATSRVSYELDASGSFVRKLYDMNGNQTQVNLLSKGKIIAAKLTYNILKDGKDYTLFMNLKIKVQTKAIEKVGIVPVTKEFAFNLFPYILNNTIKNTKFKE